MKEVVNVSLLGTCSSIHSRNKCAVFRLFVDFPSRYIAIVIGLNIISFGLSRLTAKYAFEKYKKL